MFRVPGLTEGAHLERATVTYLDFQIIKRARENAKTQLDFRGFYRQEDWCSMGGGSFSSEGGLSK